MPSIDDIWCDETRRECAQAIARWLKGSVNTQRQICQLSMAELECMAEAATSAWIVAASQRAKATGKEFEELRDATMMSLLI